MVHFDDDFFIWFVSKKVDFMLPMVHFDDDFSQGPKATLCTKKLISNGAF